MTDSPAVRIPLDPHEQPILDRLLSIRTELELLKQDKSTYVKSQDVINLYNQVVDQVELLNGIRTQKRHEQNRGEALRRLIPGSARSADNTVQLILYWTTASSSYHLRISL